jgi:diguanylate cyclase (GGDEF)-like protein/PAS domain S-box-containing protein
LKLLAGRKFQEKIGVSFILLAGLIAINALVVGLATYSIISKTELQKEIDEIVQNVVQTRLTVSGFINSLDRRMAEQVFNQIALTRQQIQAVAPGYSDEKLSSLLSQLGEFKALFQKYLIEADQKAAFESRAFALGHDMLKQVKLVRANRDAVIDYQIFDTVIGHVVSIMWQGQELQSHPSHLSAELMSKIKAELKSLKPLTQKADNTTTQRLLFRVVRDTHYYLASIESHLLYKDLNAKTKRGLFQISVKIQAECNRINLEMDATIRRHIDLTITITVVIFMVTLAMAQMLAWYLTGEILKPVHGLVSVTKKVAAGHLDVRANVEVDDAIGKLSHYFNLMTKSMKSSQEQLLEKNRALEDAHEGLEKRVKLRTRELAIANASLQSEIAARKRSEEEIRASEEKFRAMFEMSPLGMAHYTLDGLFLEANQTLQDMLGYSLENLRKRRLSDLYADEPAISWADHISTLQQSLRYSLREVRIHRQDGQILIMRLNEVLVTEGDGHESLWSICEDITEQKKSDEVIWNQANFDPLTGLPNRRMFQNSLDHEIKNSNRRSNIMALMFLDLDKFKEVNDTLGHEKGDLLLIEAARRIVDCVRETDVVARLGGDEFTVILPNLDSTSSVERVAHKIVADFAQPFYLADDKAFIGVSIGIALYPGDAGSLEALMNHADQAMYQAKVGGRNRFCYFTRTLQESYQKRNRMIKDLQDGLSKGQFELHYQPIVELTSGEIHKAEALIRWRHPTFGLVGPSEFIPLAEETGLITQIGNWVLREAAKQVKHLRENYHPRFQVSINQSPIQFRINQPYTEDWFSFISATGHLNQAIAIEITENLLQEADDHVENQLSRYREAGLQLSLDDFGCGYSSIAYLNRFDFDYLKIDREFVRKLAPNSNECALSEAITLMAHRLGLMVIAEGVETYLQHDQLQAAGCDYAQGYFFSRPLPMEEFEILLCSRALGKSINRK